MTVTVLDSTDLTGILADAGVTLDEPTPKIDGEGDKVVNQEEKVDKVEPQEDPDTEDGYGLTEEEKRVLTKNMQHAVGKRIAKLRAAEEFAAAQYSERKLAEERAARIEAELSELKSKLAPPPEQVQEAKKPDRSQFQREEEYVDAMIQWGIEQRLAEKAREDQEASRKRELEQRLETAKGRILRAVELVPDFEEVVGKVDTLLPPAIGTYLEESEMVAELSYHLAKNPDLLVSLTKMSPHSALVKIGKIESTLTPFEPKAAQNDAKSGEETPNGKPSKAAPSADTGIDLSKPRGKAAPVITPIEGTGSAGVSKDSKDMNIREAIEDFSKRNRVNLGMRKRH